MTVCVRPLPLRADRIALRHGAGGRAMRELIAAVFVADDGGPPPPAGGVGLQAMDDGAALPVGDRFLVVTTDSHVVKPPFFPGGDIGRLAVCGTVNDLAMMGATEVLALTCGVVLEEGFPLADLERLQASVRAACAEAGATIVAGDTKVMGKGELDGVMLATTGLGWAARVVPDSGLRPGDRILLTGTIGDHGLAVMALRHALELEGEIRSDVAPLNGLVRAALRAGGAAVVAMKDPTRGGVAAALHEMAEKSGVGVVLDEAAIPVAPAVAAAGELLGIDPLNVANEGKAILGVRPAAAPAVLQALRAHPLGREAAIVGTCIAEHRGAVILDTGFGRRLVPEPEGEPLPRIC
jgi:hydrogenase expression/formation protein HypE